MLPVVRNEASRVSIRRLSHRHAEQRRQHQPADTAHAGITRREPRPRQQAQLGKKRQLEQQLCHPGDQHPPGQRQDGPLQVRRQP
jgi:hypothetical protein